jgi:hypothetical protein
LGDDTATSTNPTHGSRDVVVVVVAGSDVVVVLGSVGAGVVLAVDVAVVRLGSVTLVVVREVLVVVAPQLTRTTQPESEAVFTHGSNRKHGTPDVEPTTSVVQLRYSKQSAFELEQNTLRNEFCVSVT